MLSGPEKIPLVTFAMTQNRRSSRNRPATWCGIITVKNPEFVPSAFRAWAVLPPITE